MKVEKIEKQIKSEIKQLPYTFGKLAGGILAVIGFPGMVIVSRGPNTKVADTLPYLLLGITGICIFWISSKLLDKPQNASAHLPLTPKEKRQTSMLSWVLFLIFIAILISITFIITI